MVSITINFPGALRVDQYDHPDVEKHQNSECIFFLRIIFKNKIFYIFVVEKTVLLSSLGKISSRAYHRERASSLARQKSDVIELALARSPKNLGSPARARSLV